MSPPDRQTRRARLGPLVYGLLLVAITVGVRLPAIMQHHAIDVMVCKASGGGATEAKLIAARELGLPVIMVRRPPREPGLAVDTIEAALEWLAGLDHPVEAMRMP